MHEFDIVSLGELLVDFTECGHSAAGMRLFEQNAGGGVANMAAAAAACGKKTACISKVGGDMHGAFLKAAMENAGVDMRGLRVDESVFTTLAFVALAPSGEREFSFARKPGADACLRTDELDRDLLTHTKVFFHGTISCILEPAATATREAIRIAKQAGAVIAYDPNYRASLWESQARAVDVMRSLVPTADFVKLSDEETGLMTGETDPVKASKVLADRGVKVVAVTLGGQGALVRVKDAYRLVPGFTAKAVDTTGAGDSFSGGFLSRFLDDGKRIEDVTLADAAEYARFGNATASLCVERRGGIPAMPSLADILARLA